VTVKEKQKIFEKSPIVKDFAEVSRMSLIEGS
jgi:hypothetical protein